MEKKKRGKLIATIAGVVVVLIVIITVVSGSSGGSDDMQGSSLDQNLINKVRDYAPSDTKGITYGEAFAAFYGDPTWKSFTTAENENVVEFSGKCTYKGKTGEAYLQFTVDTDGSIVDTYTQFKYDGEDTIQDLPDDARKSLILNPFIEYGNNNGKPFTEEEQYALYGESYDPSEDSEE